jgi:P-type Ca2+ transporter type 2C
VERRPTSPSAPNTPHAQPIDELAAALAVDPERGLGAAEAARRLAAVGRNELTAERRPTLVSLLWAAVNEPFVLLLMVAGTLAVALGEVRDGLLVLFGLLPIVGADVVTSYRGERALEALRETAAPNARVRRDGSALQVAAAELVPGDVVLLSVGDVVPADIRLADAEGLLIERAVLTGESLPAPASAEPDSFDAPLVERRSMAYAGTSVVEGRGEGLIVATGRRSELGRIASSLGGRGRRRSPVQRELARLVRILLSVAVGLIAITSGLALLRDEPLGVAVLAGVAAAIAAIPEEPPILLAVILGLGAYRLLRRGVLVRRLNAQETLSAVDLILTDKTGTLTRNRLGLDAILTPAGALAGDARRAAALAAYRAEDDAWHRAGGGRAGSFTSSLEAELESSAGVPQLHRSDLLASDAAGAGRPYSRTVALADGTQQEVVLGGPEAVLDLVSAGQAVSAPSAGNLDGWHQLANDHAEAGRRLLLLAAGSEGQPLSPIGLLCFSDPLRDEVSDALRMATDAGIQTIAVTGDHPRTAARIARQAGLPAGLALTGSELDEWSDERLTAELPLLRLVARALPEHKLRLVKAARAAGRTVAVTGDGVNDAPALHDADVAVAMGSGAAVAREASDLVLGDDSFATLMQGMREGRRMVANIQKGLVFLISTHVALLGFILIATVYGFSQPLLPIHILWLEFFIDVSASIAFEREPEEPGQMRQPPRPRGQPLLPSGLLGRIAVAGGWTALAALAVMAAHPGGLDGARWLAFNVLVAGQVVRAYANRSLRQPITRLRPNWFLLAASVVALGVQLLIPYVPALADAFRAAPLSAPEWLLVAVIALAPAVAANLMRAVRGSEWVG